MSLFGATTLCGSLRHLPKIMRKGFTIIETVIYTALLALVFTTLLLAVNQLLETKNQVAARLEVEEEANFLMGKIAWALSGASAITAPAPGATSTTLTAQQFNSARDPLTIGLSDGTMRMQYGAGATTTLSAESVVVRTLVFEHVAGSGNPAVRITLVLDTYSVGQFARHGAQTTAETTIALRAQ